MAFGPRDSLENHHNNHFCYPTVPAYLGIRISPLDAGLRNRSPGLNVVFFFFFVASRLKVADGGGYQSLDQRSIDGFLSVLGIQYISLGCPREGEETRTKNRLPGFRNASLPVSDLLFLALLEPLMA